MCEPEVSDDNSSTQTMKVIDLVYRQALKTFPLLAGGEGVFIDNLNKLKLLMNKLTSQDVGLDYRLLQNDQLIPKAPVTYVEIVVRDDFILNMFVVRSRRKVPLHDHPFMHGLLKVVHGSAKIRSYSLLNGPQSVITDPLVAAKKEEDLIVTDKDEAVLLTPESRNIHEIEAFDGPIAFVDVLAPPYTTDIPGLGERLCHYYTEHEFVAENNSYKLSKSLRNYEFWTDTAPYLGPPLTSQERCFVGVRHLIDAENNVIRNISHVEKHMYIHIHLKT